jgi:hypothetical protein
MCTSRDMTTHLDYFLHFSSQPHLGQFINEALNRANYSGAPALVFLSHQRLSLLRSQAYVESDVYQVQGNEVRALGRIRYEGNES